MKPRFAGHQNRAFTLIELLVVITVLVVLLMWIGIGPSQSSKRKAQRIACISNLKEMGMAFRLWEGDHSDKYPMSVLVTNSGAMEWAAAGKAHVWWQTMSNQLVSPGVLWCPADAKAAPASSFATGFGDANISYFISLDADETYPQMIMAGDDNLLANGKPVQPGILNLWTNTTLAWANDRHRGVGNLGMADGSAQQVTSASLNSAMVLAANGVPKNKVMNGWLIP